MKAIGMLLAGVLLTAGPAMSQGARNIEPEARAIEAQLVAPCCWSQQVSVHQSEAASQIKADVRQALLEGRTKDEILESYVDKYGPQILIEPPARGFGASLYVIPVIAFVLSAAGVGVLVRRFARRGATPAEAPAIGAPKPVENGDLAARLDDELSEMD